MIDFAQVYPRVESKTTALEILDAVIGGLCLIACLVVSSGVIFLLK